MKLTKGNELNSKQVQDVKARFVHRFTGEFFPQWASKPMPNGQSYKPTHKTDSDWITDHAFYIRDDGRVADNPKYCEPVYAAE